MAFVDQPHERHFQIGEAEMEISKPGLGSPFLPLLNTSSMKGSWFEHLGESKGMACVFVRSQSSIMGEWSACHSSLPSNLVQWPTFPRWLECISECAGWQSVFTLVRTLSIKMSENIIDMCTRSCHPFETRRLSRYGSLQLASHF